MFASSTLADRPCLTSSALTSSEQQIVQAATAILERRLFQRGPALASPQDVIDYLRLTVSREDREVFTVIFLDTRHRVIAVEPLFFGTIDGAQVVPRVILHRALLLNSAAIIAAHFVARHKIWHHAPRFLMRPIGSIAAYSLNF